MNWLEIATILVIGFVGSAEFGSAVLVHPVIRRLEPDAQLIFEKGLLTTFGRIMPVGMTVSTVLAIVVAIASPSAWLIAAAVSLGVALTVTIIGNVPINLRTGRIDQEGVPEGFIAMRRRWDVFQLSRASLQLLGFILVTVGIVGR
ncbi:MAG: anthrone oxygenase family protein [Mycobacteriaceae bacterium]|uniref:anthrone oxygenase family protein n=1 Tax=Corynebacterium sp. TaxID=1720 RepID=UPI003F9E1C9A